MSSFNNPEALNKNPEGTLMEKSDKPPSLEALQKKHGQFFAKAGEDMSKFKERTDSVKDMVEALRKKSAGDRVASDNVERV